MKQILIGGFLFLGGCIIFAACLICPCFEGVVPSQVQGEKILSVLLMGIGIVSMAWDFLKQMNRHSGGRDNET